MNKTDNVYTCTCTTTVYGYYSTVLHSAFKCTYTPKQYVACYHK